MQTYFFIIGPPQNGKTTIANYISKKLGLKYASTSSIVYRELARSKGLSLEQTYKLPKEQIRPELVVVADKMCDADATVLVDGLVKDGANIIDGIRRKFELRKSVEKLTLQGHKVHVWYVVDNRKALIKDNTEIDGTDADIIILNNGSFEALYGKLDTLLP